MIQTPPQIGKPRPSNLLNTTFKFMLPTWPQYNATFIKRSSAKSWTRSWLYQSQDSANVRNLDKEEKGDRMAEKYKRTHLKQMQIN